MQFVEMFGAPEQLWVYNSINKYLILINTFKCIFETNGKLASFIEIAKFKSFKKFILHISCEIRIIY